MHDDLPQMEIDPQLFTRKRVMVTTRVPKNAPEDALPWVVLEAEDGCGLIIAMTGPDSPQSRADGARIMELWNAALDAENPRH